MLAIKSPPWSRRLALGLDQFDPIFVWAVEVVEAAMVAVVDRHDHLPLHGHPAGGLDGIVQALTSSPV